MRVISRFLAVIFAAALLGGCWQAEQRFYRPSEFRMPLHEGRVTSTGPDGQTEHYKLEKIGRHYRLTGTDRGENFGEQFQFGLAPLKGGPSSVLVYQAEPLDHPIDAHSLRYYGLLVIEKGRFREMRPDCIKDMDAAAVSGTRAGGDGACTFKSRAGLEKSLLALWRSHKKAAYIYKIE